MSKSGSAREEARRAREEAWAAGDYSVFGGRLAIVSELLCEAVDLRAGRRVLDVATGTGNTALAAARRGCRVTGIDVTRPLLEQARRRAEAEHLEVELERGDVDELRFPDETFDFVLSTFGVQFAEDPRRAADELLRVCRRGGRIGLANWTRTGAGAAEDRALSAHFPQPAGAPPSPWITTEGLRELFGERVSSLRIEARRVFYRFPSMEDYLDAAFGCLGPLVQLVEPLGGEQRARLRWDLAAALEPFNVSGDESLVLPFDYLEVVATRSA